MMPALSAPQRRILLIILLIALVLRLIYALAQNQTDLYTPRGGDTAYYLLNGYALVTGDELGQHTDLSHLPTAPLYLVVIGAIQAILTRAAGAIIVIRVLQALIGTGIVYAGYQLTRRITGQAGPALLAAALLAISLGLIVESAQILTETLYMGLLCAGLVVFVEAVTDPAERPVTRKIILAGVLLGLATLTRAVLLLFPVGLALHWLLARGWRNGWKQVMLLLGVYALVVSSWTIYSLARWNRFVIGAEGMTSFIYVGSRGWDEPDVVDQALIEDLGAEGTPVEDVQDDSDYLEAAGNVIRRDPAGYVAHRVNELGQAYVQPHNTVIFGGESLKSELSAWFQEDRTPGGLWDLMQWAEFWPKLALYVFHFGGLLLGVVGMWLTRDQWRATLPLIGLIVYTSLLHLVMLALPRYLFPLYPIWWIFAAVVLARALGWGWLRIRRSAPG